MSSNFPNTKRPLLSLAVKENIDLSITPFSFIALTILLEEFPRPRPKVPMASCVELATTKGKSSKDSPPILKVSSTNSPTVLTPLVVKLADAMRDEVDEESRSNDPKVLQ